jgi:3-oxoacyl-[acyl-carrier-protein] synthase-3
MRYAEITGWGKAMPPTVLTNHDLEQIVDTNDEWITSRSGIKERRISHVEISEMGAVAAQHALAAAGREPGEIDLIICATLTPDSTVPASAALLQDRIGANGAAAFDLNANCSGFVYGMVVADSMIKTGAATRALLVGVEKLSYVTDYTDRSTCVLFGDGAGAVVLEATDEPIGLLASRLGNDGSAAPFLCIPESGTRGTPGHPDPRKAGIYMEGPEVFKRAVKGMGGASSAVVEEMGWTIDDIDLLIPHQANQRIIDAVARRIGLDDTKVFVNIQSYGNTSAATVPVALTEALEQGRIKPGANLVFAAFGGGLSYGAAAVRWGQRVEPVGVSDAAIPATDRSVWDVLGPNLEFFGATRKVLL